MPDRQTKRKKPGSQDVVATADEKLMRHIRALGLESPAAYRSWCRQQGFSDSPRKSWQECRQERQAAKKSEVESVANRELLAHIEALGLNSADEYRSWCRRHGFSDALNKNRPQRQQERLAAERAKGQAALAGTRRHMRRPQDTLQAIYRREIGEDELKSPVLRKIHALFAALEGEENSREAFLHLLLHTEKQSHLLHVEPVIPHVGPQPGNTFPEGLLALARRHESWLRPVELWKPDSHNARRQFGSLARHLLASYFVPAFMDAAWFRGDSPEALQQQRWFQHIGIGQNIRTADIPLRLTKMMAHCFLQAPGDYPIEAALRWGQILGLGGDEPLVRAVVSTRLGESFENEEFWATVLHFFVNNPMLDTACVGPIVDYIYHQKYMPREVVGEDGVIRLGDPAQPDFSMKGRSANALLARVEEWHAHLAREARKPRDCWESSCIEGFRLIEEDKEAGNVVCWAIEEILTSEELRAEGKAMHHCVASYGRSCAKGTVSVWSMQVEDCQTTWRRRVMTIAVQNATRTINQARGRKNVFPGGKDSGARLKKGQAILQQWAHQEGLTVGRHL
jgi:hypothetical protein